MLSSKLIKTEIENGRIKIEPFDENNLHGVSYDMEIEDTVKVFYQKSKPLDTHYLPEPDQIVVMDECNDQILLNPGYLYHFTTKEKVSSKFYVPCVSGRSSVARYGITVHQTAFFANPGHEFNWVLEVSCIVPVIVHRFDKLSQLYFEEITGEIPDTYTGKYSEINTISLPIDNSI